MKKAIPIVLGLAAVASLGIPFLFPHPQRAEGLSVPTVYLPGGNFEMPIKLDDHESVNGFRRLDDIQVRVEGQSPAGDKLSADGLQFKARANDDWGTVRVERNQDPTKAMPYAFLRITLPEGDAWRGAQITLFASATLAYPEYATGSNLSEEAGYVVSTVPITRDYSIKIATREEEQDAIAKKALWDAADKDFMERLDRWDTTLMVGIIAAGVFLLACIASFFLLRRSA
jgi:hypothetical protein